MIKKILRKLLNIKSPPKPVEQIIDGFGWEPSDEERIHEFVNSLKLEITREEIDLCWAYTKKAVETIVHNYNPEAKNFAIPQSIGNDLVRGFAIVFAGKNRRDSRIIDEGLIIITNAKCEADQFIKDTDDCFRLS